MSIKKLDDNTVVFACTEDDMAAGGYIAKRDPRAHHQPTDEERRHIVKMFEGFRALQDMGWRPAMYAPQDNTPFLAIEIGSAGVHECSRDAEGHFWIYDGDVWPAKPVLWKPMPVREDEG